ncbi:MAG: hypothetical protein L0H53_00540 [Candidatus Nitrosocosmicus sp.]|nr:hypothetical protein [Candidatus Nitrosocosmicus sp.]
METQRERLQQLRETSQYSDALVNIPFWIKDPNLHRIYWNKCKFKDHKGFCCFTHAVGLPYKDGFGYLPWFNYQTAFLDALSLYKLIRVLKATGLGFSEIMLYLYGHVAYFPEYRDKESQIVIITGPNIDIAKKLIKRLVTILQQRLKLSLKTTQTTIEIKNCTIEAFPSHHIDAARSLPNPVHCLFDESDFSPYEHDDPNNPLSLLERYIPKSNPWIIPITTPGMPGGINERMDEEETKAIEEGKIPRYKTFRFNYEWGLGKIYRPEDIERAKESPSFEREYNLKYGYGIGNIYDEVWIGNALLKGRRLKHVPVSTHSKKSMGLDPAHGSSKFGVTIIEYLPYCNLKLNNDPPEFEPVTNIKRVILSAEFSRELYEKMVNMCYGWIKEYGIDYVFCDGSQVEFIRSLKAKIEEKTAYENLVKRAREYNTPLSDYMTIIPILNQTDEGKIIVDESKYWMGVSKTIAIDEENCKPLLGQMRSAKQKVDGKLDKDKLTTKSTTFDSLESFHYALKYWRHNQ